MTIRNIPAEVKKRMQAQARAKGTSVNQVAVDLLSGGVGVTGSPKANRDLSFMRMSAADAQAIEAAHQDFEIIDPEAWK